MTDRIRLRPLTGTKYEGVNLNKPKKEKPEDAVVRIEASYFHRATTPMRAIRAMCIQCQGGQVHEVNACKITSCALHAFRMERKRKQSV